MPRRSELGWILAMAVVAVTLGFLIGGGPSLLSAPSGDVAVELQTASPDASTTTTTPSTTSTSEAPETTTTTIASSSRAPRDVSVRVYNGSTKGGQAVRVGDRLKLGGYRVLAPGPSPSDPLPASVIHFVEGYAAEAAALAAAMGLPSTAPAPMPTPSPVKDVGPAHLVLIVADDLLLSP